ncbi:FxLD family lantipeptide [Streptomyces sp. FT05W]|uniref:FxLD family lanthipeptide n=1 Tax=Streptomyces glycanivorans TaxID=3033808 RepID=A0ABY9JFT4_9ACTN|nr:MULTISPECIES: FxLD family lanthipeptide [Streptomyces]MBL1285638.1 FxLD family lanthipeptide [Streptomyces silvae]PWS51047.1 FxLD family lantipeptide [Streptomyces sp. FT05W]WLQ66621.1 FxLD family lanthipeptide [Streptomyces sp. Alt3]
MTVQMERPLTPAQSVVTPKSSGETADWELDITIVEGGPAADQLIRLTGDGCNSTCATACTSCP